jgi:hypothetical protein
LRTRRGRRPCQYLRLHRGVVAGVLAVALVVYDAAVVGFLVVVVALVVYDAGVVGFVVVAVVDGLVVPCEAGLVVVVVVVVAVVAVAVAVIAVYDGGAYVGMVGRRRPYIPSRSTRRP